MNGSLPRRRAITICATMAGLGLLAIGKPARAAGETATWRGTVLGAEASLRIRHHDRTEAQRLIDLSLREARRLERIFSLYLGDSVLAELNRRSVLGAPPVELVELLGQCRRYWSLTGGAFDPTVQPLWLLHQAHFSRRQADPAGPSNAAIAAALQHVGCADVLVSRDRIAFSRRGMSLTLNGIAQGYITDRVVSLLRMHGVRHSLVDMGEARAIGARPDGTAWSVGIADQGRRSGSETFQIVDQAVATSGGYGFRFDEAGRFTHLFDPRTGRSPHRYRSVTVVAPTATAADALSTAFTLLAPGHIREIMESVGDGQVRLQLEDGEWTIIGA